MFANLVKTLWCSLIILKIQSQAVSKQLLCVRWHGDTLYVTLRKFCPRNVDRKHLDTGKEHLQIQNQHEKRENTLLHSL